MSDMGGGPAESWSPDEGTGGAPEELSEEAKARFAAAGAAMKQIRKEEKQSKKRDDQVAQVIVQFLGIKKYAHLFVLISRLVGRDCPSIFILAIISLVHDGAKEEVEKYIKDTLQKSAGETVDESMALTTAGDLDANMNRILVEWITRLQMVLAVSPDKILLKLMVDDKNIDGSVLQLTTFVVQEFFRENKRDAPFEKIQPLTASILQTVFEPYIGKVRKMLLEEAEAKQKNDEDDDEDE